MSYKFDANLLKASKSKDIALAKLEWRWVRDDSRPEQDVQCICQRWIKHLNYYHNIETGYTIALGSGCAKKVGLPDRGLPGPLAEVLKERLERGEYSTIDNMLIYSDSIQKELIAYFQRKFKESQRKCNQKWVLEENIAEAIFKLKVILNELSELIWEDNLSYLRPMYAETKDRIRFLCDAKIMGERKYTAPIRPVSPKRMKVRGASASVATPVVAPNPPGMEPRRSFLEQNNHGTLARVTSNGRTRRVWRSSSNGSLPDH
jgi:hypothetical protein